MTRYFRSAALLRRFAFVLATVVLLSSCAHAPRAPQPAPSLLLVSIDGFHPDFIDPRNTPTLARLAEDGVRAEWVTPSYPSLTFPNHYTLVTGLRPDRHGIVHNSMRDPALGPFALKDRAAVGNGAWWQGEPIWVAAERAGLRSATLFWPGTEAEIGGVRPQRWTAFDPALPIAQRVRTVLDWLSEADTTRPHFATLYFEHVDNAGHHSGPRSDATREAAHAVDAALGQLVAGLRERGLLARTNIVVVSDHGMAEVPPGQRIATEDMVDPAIAEAVSYGQVVGFAPADGQQAAAESALLGRHARYACWRKDALPAAWDHGRHPRVPPIVCQMDEGWDALPRAVIARIPATATRGSHGYDPALPSMRAIFIAHGPAFRRGAVLPAVENVDVYPLLARLLGVTPAPHDGDPDALAPALAD